MVLLYESSVRYRAKGCQLLPWYTAEWVYRRFLVCPDGGIEKAPVTVNRLLSKNGMSSVLFFRLQSTHCDSF
jgi:hypothetical protein